MSAKIVKWKTDVKSVKLVDYAFQFALLMALFFCLGEEVLKIMVITFCIFYFWLVLLMWAKKAKMVKRVKFLGNIDELTFLMIYEFSLSLNRKVGNYYVFQTNNKIMPNFECYIRDYESHCILDECFNDLCQIDKRFEFVKTSKELQNK